MTMVDKDDGELYTHKEDGGIYSYRGIAHGTGEQRGQVLHVYSDYFSDLTFYRGADMSERMERISAKGLRFGRMFRPAFWLTTCIGLVLIAAMQVMMGNLDLSVEQDARFVRNLIGPAVIATLVMSAARFPMYYLYKWKYGKSKTA